MSASATELQRRVVYSLLRPAVRLARRFRLPLKTLEELVRLAYFEELRRGRGLAQSEVARIFGKSLRTVGMLEKQARGDFLAPEREVELTRRVEDALDTGSTADAVADQLGEPVDAVERVVAGLLGAGRAERLPDGRVALDRSYVSLVSEALVARVDGLNHQLDVLVSAVSARFLNGRGPATARTLSFVGTDEIIEALGAELARLARQKCGDAEEAALEAGGHRDFGFTFALAPLDEDDQA
jgi:hypothetical protein